MNGIEKSITKLGIIALVVGLLMDLIVKVTNHYIIIVDQSFITNVYAALFTIAALSGTVLTIIISSFSTKHYGFTFKEILYFKSHKINFSNFIPLSLCIVAVATLLVALKLINTTVMALFFLIVVIINYTNNIWEISSNDIKCKEIIKAELLGIAHSGDYVKIKKAINNLFDSFKLNLEEKSMILSNDIMGLIELVLEETDLNNKELVTFIDQKIYETFIFAISTIGFTVAIEKVLFLHDIINSKFSTFDKRRALFKPIEKLKFCDIEKFSGSNLVYLYNTLEDVKYLSKDEKIYILYQYFSCLLSNQIIHLEYKDELIESYLYHITDFSYSESTEYDEVRKQVILYIARDYILTNADNEIRTKLFITLTNQLYDKRYTKCAEYCETLALLYQALYFYSFYETETLQKKHRESIKELINLNAESIDTIKVTFKGLLYQYNEQIITSLLNMAIRARSDYSLFEYFPKNFGAKTSVWTKRAGLEFAFSTYLLSYYYCNNYPYKMINDWDSLDVDEKKLVINTFLSYFDDKTKHLNKDALKELIQLSAWIERKYDTNVNFLESLYDELNFQMQRLNEEKFISPATSIPDLEEINRLLVTQIVEYKKLFGYATEITITGKDEITFRPEVEEFQYCYNALNISAKICMYIGELLNSIAKKKLPMLMLSFDRDGVIKLLEELKRKKYNSRNYTFVDDWGLSKETRKLPEYEALVEEIKSIEFYHTSPFTPHMFFNKEDMKFNVSVSNYLLDTLNENQCDKYAERFMVADGFYKIHGALYNKSQAMEIIHQTYRIQYISVKLRTSITEESGFTVGFNYKLDNESDGEDDEVVPDKIV